MSDTFTTLDGITVDDIPVKFNSEDILTDSFVVDPTLTVSGAAADAKVTGDEIGALKEGLSQIESYITVGFNLFDKSKLESGKRLSVDTGNPVDVAGYSTTELIPLTHDYPRIRSSIQPDRLVIYNSSKEKIEAHSSYYAQAIDSAAYIRFCYADANTDYNNLMIAYTSETSNASVNTWATIFPNLGYVPYIPTVDNDKIYNFLVDDHSSRIGNYALAPVAKLANNFMKADGTYSSSNDWELYAYDIVNGFDYVIKTFINTTTTTGTSKAFYAIIDKPISGVLTYSASNVLETSEMLGGSTLGVAYSERYVNRKISINSQTAKTLVVCRGKLGGAQYPTIVEPVVADKSIKYNATLIDLQNFADIENGVYIFDTSFSFIMQNSDLRHPKIVEAFSTYSGQQPTIQFKQGYLYTSNIFDIGDPTEYRNQSWRIPAPTEYDHPVVKVIVTIPQWINA